MESPLASTPTSTPAPATGQEEDHAREKLESKLTLSWFVFSAAIKNPPAQLVVRLRARSKVCACARAGAVRDHNLLARTSET